MKYFQPPASHPPLLPEPQWTDGRTHCEEAGWHHAALRKGLRPQSGPKQQVWPCRPSSWSPEGLGNTAARVWLSFRLMFSRPGSRGRFAALRQPGSPLAAGLWHGAGAAAALGRQRSHLFPSPARSTSQAANWDISPRHKRLDKHLHPHESPFPGREGGEQGEVQAQRVPASPHGVPSHRRHRLPVLTIIGASPILSLKEQHLSRGGEAGGRFF